jgi:hypothetical protein
MAAAKTWREIDAEERQAWAADAEAVQRECGVCGEQDVWCHAAVDPFVMEGISDGPKRRQWWCYDCLDRRAGDV